MTLTLLFWAAILWGAAWFLCRWLEGGSVIDEMPLNREEP